MTKYDLAGNPLPDDSGGRTDLSGNPLPPQGQSPYGQPSPSAHPQPGGAWPPPPNAAGYGRPQSYESVNSTAILILAVVGFIVPFCSLISVIWSYSAVKKIDSGAGDPAERSKVMTARLLGYLSIAIGVIFGAYRGYMVGQQFSHPTTQYSAPLR